MVRKRKPTKRKNAHPGYWPVILGGPSRRPKARKPSRLSSAIRRLGGTRIVKIGDHYEVPSLDRGSWFDTRAEAQRFIKAVKRNPKRKRNVELAIPKNKFVNAKVRMKGSKLQVMVDERVLGHVGASGSAGLSGVSVKGSAKLNPKKRKRLKVYKIKYGMNYLYARGGRTVKYRSQSEAQAIEHFKLNHPEEFRSHDWRLVS